MKKILNIVVFILILSVSAFAQNKNAKAVRDTVYKVLTTQFDTIYVNIKLNLDSLKEKSIRHILINNTPVLFTIESDSIDFFSLTSQKMDTIPVIIDNSIHKFNLIDNFVKTPKCQTAMQAQLVKRSQAAIKWADNLPPKPTVKFNGTPSLDLTQTAFSNWAAGGANSVAAVASSFFKLSYAEPKFTWESTLSLAYGLTHQENKFFKNQDKIDFITKFGIKSSRHWYYSLMFQFKTQFDTGYSSYPPKDKANYTSKFMSPAYLLGSLGMDYKPDQHYSFLLSPVTAKCTFVLDSLLSEKGTYGLSPGKKAKNEIGSLVRIVYSRKFESGTTLNANIELFSSWLNEPKNIDLGIEIDYKVKFNRWLSTSFYSKLMYDNNVKFKNSAGETTGPKLQFKQILGAGISVSF